MNTKVIITAEDQTGAGIASVKSSMVGLGATVGIFTSLTQNAISAISELASQTIGLYKEQIKVADGMDEMSVRMGMSIKDLVAFQAAAEMNGASLEAMAAGTRMLAKHMTEHGAALKKAGIDSKDANGAFMQLADLFKGMTDPMQRLDLATRIFGRGLGQQLLPMLVGGSEGLKAIRETTDGYGEALTRLSPEAQKLNDTLYLMGVRIKQASAEGVLPLVRDFNEMLLPAMDDANKKGTLMNDMVGGLVEGLRAVVVFGANVAFVLRGIGTEIGGMAAQAAALGRGDLAGFNAIGEAMKEDAALARKEFDALEARLMKAGSGTGAGAAPALMVPGANTDAEATALAASMRSKGGKGAGKPAKTRLQVLMDEQKKRIAALDSELYASAGDEQMVSVDSVARQYATRNAAESEKASEKIKDSIEPLRVLRREIDEVNKLREAHTLTAEQAAAAEAKLADEFSRARVAMVDLGNDGKDAFAGITDAIDNFGNKAADTFADFVMGGKASFSDLINSMLKDILRLQAKQMFDPITKGAGNWLTGALKGAFGADGGQGSVQGNADYIWDLHSGGIAGAGEGSGRHLRNLALFAGAPKYHGGGLAGDEMPAILKKGEGVFTPGQMKAMGGGVVNNVSVVVNSDGGSSQGDSTQAAELGRRIEGAVRAVLMAEKRPRGLLGNG